MLKQLFNKIKEDWKRDELEANLYVLDCSRKRYVKGIATEKYQFHDNETMTDFINLLADNLSHKYQAYGKLSPFEHEVMNKALKDGIYDMSFFLSSALNEEPGKEDIIHNLLSEGFQLLEGVGYIQTKRRIPFIVV